MEGLIKIFNKAVDVYHFITVNLAQLILVIVMFMITAEVLSRLFLNKSLQIVVQFSGMSLFMITFLAVAWVLKEDRHIYVEFLLDLMSEKTRRIVNVITLIFGTLLCIYLFFEASIYVAEVWEAGKTTEYPFRIPQAPILLLIPLGWFFCVVEFIKKCVAQIKPVGKRTT